MGYSFLNPFFIYSICWLSVLGLLNLRITNNIGDIHIESTLIIIINIITGFLIYLYYKEKYHLNNIKNISKSIQIAECGKFIARLSVVWFLLVIIDIVYSNGFPLLWIFVGAESDYTNLGIPSLKGLQHTLYLFIFTIKSIIIKNGGFKNESFNSKIFIYFLIIYPIIMLSRSLMMYAGFQIFCCIIFNTKIKYTHALKLLILFFTTILLFGLIGDYRGANQNPFYYLINPNYSEIMEALPNGFTWFYVYLTANYNNINTTLGTYQLSYSFLDIFYNLTPGFLKSLLITQKESVLITDENLNVASFYAGYITSFGMIGAIVGGVLLQLLATKYYYKARTGNIGYIATYSILFSCLLISVFFDALMTVSTVAQLIMGLVLAKNINKFKV